MFTHHVNTSHTDRFDGVERVYSIDDVHRLSGTIQVEHTLAHNGAEQLWSMLICLLYTSPSPRD